VIYSYIDRYGNLVSQTITVTVVAADTKASIVAKDTTLTQGSTWNAEAGFVSGTDADGNAISFADVRVSGDTVDTSKTGTYQVTYTYTDKYGNEVSQTITVTVTAKDTDNNGGTDTGNNGNSNNNGGTDTGDSSNGNNSDGTDVGNANGAAEIGSDADTATNNTDSTTTTTSIGSTVNAGYQASSTEVKTVKLNAKVKGAAVDRIAKSSLPQTGESTKKTPTLMGLVLLGLTSLLALAGIKRQQ